MMGGCGTHRAGQKPSALCRPQTGATSHSQVDGVMLHPGPFWSRAQERMTEQRARS